MGRRLTPIEKLAREICWAGFALPQSVGCTKSQYWNQLPEHTRNRYREEAERFAFLLANIDVDVLNEVHGRGAD